MMSSFTADELQQLLGRAPRAIVAPRDRAAFAGRRVLITGAGGSIGSALARELAACRPAVLALVDQSELGLFSVEREIHERWPAVPVEPYLTDVTRRAAIARACRETAPDVVYHAAAYKHVTMAERAAAAAARVNVCGTAETAAAAAAVGARFVLISSDKAANPKSVMGATKRLAELVVLRMASAGFRPVVVRFGNVLGSSGSVLPIMRECVRQGRPIPLTDPGATRFFMTASEAVALVLRADLIGRTAETFWLDMGRPVRLGDLATRLLALEAARGHAPVPLHVVGLRPGEKRNEILADPQLVFERTVDRRIRVARQALLPSARQARALARLQRAAVRADDAATLTALTDALEGFAPSAAARARAGRFTARPAPVDSARRRGRAA